MASGNVVHLTQRTFLYCCDKRRWQETYGLTAPSAADRCTMLGEILSCRLTQLPFETKVSYLLAGDETETELLLIRNAGFPLVPWRRDKAAPLAGPHVQPTSEAAAARGLDRILTGAIWAFVVLFLVCVLGMLVLNPPAW